MTAPAPLPNALDLIGNTPLVLLKGPSEAAGCEIWGKCEFANPGASVKDRAALWIVRDAEARGTLMPGGTIVEGTAGNTGIGLALVANALGYKTVIVMPETQSRERWIRCARWVPSWCWCRRRRSRTQATSSTLRAASPKRPKARSGPTSS